jgi:hypothetical protein
MRIAGGGQTHQAEQHRTLPSKVHGWFSRNGRASPPSQSMHVVNAHRKQRRIDRNWTAGPEHIKQTHSLLEGLFRVDDSP